MTRIYVTGCGVFVPGGKSLIEFWDTLINGKSQSGLITSFDSSDLPTHIGAEVKDSDPNRYLWFNGLRWINSVQHSWW